MCVCVWIAKRRRDEKTGGMCSSTLSQHALDLLHSHESGRCLLLIVCLTVMGYTGTRTVSVQQPSGRLTDLTDTSLEMKATVTVNQLEHRRETQSPTCPKRSRPVAPLHFFPFHHPSIPRIIARSQTPSKEE